MSFLPPVIPSEPTNPTLVDSFGRKIDYLRVSITDQCNERCLYCRPAAYRGWAPRPEHLSAAEFVRVVHDAVQAGILHVRLTGGEPLLRPDLLEIVEGISSLRRLQSLSLSTNGTLLAPLAIKLREAGIQSINLSLDALHTDLYRQITGGSLNDFLEGFRSALAAGFQQIKLNCVLLRGRNEQELRPLVHFAAEHQVSIRFIELMPLTLLTEPKEDLFLSARDAWEILGGKENLTPDPSFHGGHGPARYFRDRPSGAVVGLIGAITFPDFCFSCNKLRLTADGKLRPCLGRHGEIDLRHELRHGSGRTENLLRQAVDQKPKDHEFSVGYKPSRPMTALGG
ncbi:GTP 3',8-cyclase MoaA [bacterium]|nr:GTP 3',8-cyclase MoaA [bacterium]